MVNEIYLDNAATTPVHPGVAKAVMDCMMYTYGNPSSLHRLGLNAEKRLRQPGNNWLLHWVTARTAFFTSGGRKPITLLSSGPPWQENVRKTLYNHSD